MMESVHSLKSDDWIVVVATSATRTERHAPKLLRNKSYRNMPRKGAAAGKKKPLKNKSKGRKEMTPEEKAFKAKQAADKKAAAAYLKGKKK